MKIKTLFYTNRFNDGIKPLLKSLEGKGYDYSFIGMNTKFYGFGSRNRAIKDYKFAGGPDLKVGTDAKIDPKKINKDMTDTTHLPDFKKVILTAGQDAKKRKQIC